MGRRCCDNRDLIPPQRADLSPMTDYTTHACIACTFTYTYMTLFRAAVAVVLSRSARAAELRSSIGMRLVVAINTYGTKDK